MSKDTIKKNNIKHVEILQSRVMFKTAMVLYSRLTMDHNIQ